MANIFRTAGMVGLALALALPTVANAQDINLATGGADQIWKGTQPNAAAGLSLGQGAVGNDGRRDLIVGSPGGPGIPGAVYVIFGGPTRTGEFVLSSAETVITSSEAGNRFGASTAAGNVLNLEGVTPRALAIGAPGALGGRGAVYLFTAGFNTGGPHLTEADAVFTILGAPGDQLGSTLGTGDLDNDGYREIIIGAPGTNRVYVIKGGPTLAGTRDLSVTTADRTLVSAGFGGVLTAGDVTGDGIHDLIVGAPSQNLAFLYAGTAGTIPSVPVSSFGGVDAGDEAGSAIRILDINADGKSDLVITAPGGDGPDNTRASAGEAYLFLGPVGPGAVSLASAPIVFFGGAAGRRAGVDLTAGDINRDTPNDLVLLAPGGSGGAGELNIYYGRSRNSTGVLQPDGRRFVDFGVAGQVSRRILGDPTVAPITSAQVFEVTGEGARDIIVGVAGADSGAGALYFTISPKLRVTPTTMTLLANEGSSATSATPVQVLNASSVFIGWETTANVPWLTTSPTAGSADQTHPSAFYVVGSAAGLTPGVHTGRVNARSTSPDLEMTLPVNVTFTVTGTRIALDQPVHGTQVPTTFTVSGWAVDVAAASGTGVSEIQVYAYPNPGSGETGTLLGTAAYGAPRSDVGGLYGARFTNSGYSLAVNSLAAGTTYQIAVFAKSTVSNQFMLSRTAVVTVVAPGTTPDPTPNPTPNPNPGPTPTPNPTPNDPGPTPDPGTTPTADTRVSVNRSGLFFGALAGNNGLKSGAQTVAVAFANGGSTWTATTDASWLEITSGSGAGGGAFSVAVRNGNYPLGPPMTASITITAVNVPNSPITLPVTLTRHASGGNPFGLIDTPVNNTTGITGAIAVTGWALDDIGVREVTLWRDTVAGETSSAANGKIFIGRAAPVDGARPDVDGSYSQPFDYQAGWGYMLLTNMLPSQGNGTFVLHVYAQDVEGRTVQLGSRTITCDNAHATRPFGAIDTPDQGGTVNGAGYTNFGWALTPQPNMIPADGSTIVVFIDGVPVGRPTYNQPRADIAALFPGRANSDGAIGFFQFDTTQLSNGVHTIAWSVTDNNGNSEGIGSRYFTVLNGATSSAITVETNSSIQASLGLGPEVRQASGSGEATGQAAAALDSTPVSETPVYMRRGFSPSAPLDIVDGRGVATINATEMDRFQLTLGSPVTGDGDRYEGYVVANGRLQPLPSGAFLDRKTGEFFWQPGVGFIGTYRMVFVRIADGARERIPVTVVIQQKQ